MKYTRKDSEIIISNNQKYFEELNDVSEIFILGHSMGDVDKFKIYYSQVENYF